MIKITKKDFLPINPIPIVESLLHHILPSLSDFKPREISCNTQKIYIEDSVAIIGRVSDGFKRYDVYYSKEKQKLFLIIFQKENKKLEEIIGSEYFTVSEFTGLLALEYIFKLFSNYIFHKNYYEYLSQIDRNSLPFDYTTEKTLIDPIITE